MPVYAHDSFYGGIMSKILSTIWPDRDEMRHRWNPNATEDYKRQANAIGAGIIPIGVMISLLTMKLPYGDAVTILWAILIFTTSMFALMCSRRAHGVLREIDVAIAPHVRMMESLNPKTRDIVMAHLPPTLHPDDESVEDDPTDPPPPDGPPNLRVLD